MLGFSDYDPSHYSNCDIWIMKEYWVQISWTKHFVIEIPNYSGWFCYLPMKLLNNDEEILLLHNDKKLVRYNFEEQVRFEDFWK